MSGYSRDRFIREWYASQEGQQFIVRDIFEGKCFEKRLGQLYATHRPKRELIHKDEMLKKGIQYAYFDIEGRGIEFCEDKDRSEYFFIKGYDIGNRKRKIEGMTACFNGVDLLSIPEEIRFHHKFIDGYNLVKNTDQKPNIKSKHK